MSPSFLPWWGCVRGASGFLSRLNIHSVIFRLLGATEQLPQHMVEPPLSSVLLCSSLGSGDSRQLAAGRVTTLSWSGSLSFMCPTFSPVSKVISVTLFWDKNIYSSNCFSRQLPKPADVYHSIRVASFLNSLLPPRFAQQNVNCCSIWLIKQE